MSGLEIRFEEASEILFPFINDAPCLSEFILSEKSQEFSQNFMIKVMERDFNEKIINVLYSKRKNLDLRGLSEWLKVA